MNNKKLEEEIRLYEKIVSSLEDELYETKVVLKELINKQKERSQ